MGEKDGKSLDFKYLTKSQPALIVFQLLITHKTQYSLLSSRSFYVLGFCSSLGFLVLCCAFIIFLVKLMKIISIYISIHVTAILSCIMLTYKYRGLFYLFVFVCFVFYIKELFTGPHFPCCLSCCHIFAFNSC